MKGTPDSRIESLLLELVHEVAHHAVERFLSDGGLVVLLRPLQDVQQSRYLAPEIALHPRFPSRSAFASIPTHLVLAGHFVIVDLLIKAISCKEAERSYSERRSQVPGPFAVASACCGCVGCRAAASCSGLGHCAAARYQRRALFSFSALPARDFEYRDTFHEVLDVIAVAFAVSTDGRSKALGNVASSAAARAAERSQLSSRRKRTVITSVTATSSA